MATDPTQKLELSGWHRLVESVSGRGVAYPLPAYSEFMPAPRLGITPYGGIDPDLFSESDPYGWSVPETEELFQLRPGLERIAEHLMEHVLNLGRRGADAHIGEHRGQNFVGNPYWPADLASRLPTLTHERFVCFLPLALSVTQDDKGRRLWSMFGGSEQGPETVFWKSFFSAPGQELPADSFYKFLAPILSAAYGEVISGIQNLQEIGFGLLPASEASTALLPSWARPLILHEDSSFADIRYLLTFRPFTDLPEEVKSAYLAGKLHLLPFPGSLVFWGMPTYARLQHSLPLAGQIPLLRVVPRHAGPDGIRVPQSGWIHEPSPDLDPAEIEKEILEHDYTRTHRWDRHRRYEDELAVNPRLEKVAKVLFSTDLDVLGFYDKPMARNVQLWNANFELVLDGPNATREELKRAEADIAEGGVFGYRFLFPAARVGNYEVYWHRPLVAYQTAAGEVELHPDPLLGFMTGYAQGAKTLSDPVELWPRLQDRPDYRSALTAMHNPHDWYLNETPLNLVSLLDAWHQLGEKPLPPGFVRHLLRMAKETSLEEWIASLADDGIDPQQGAAMQVRVRSMIVSPGEVHPLPEPLTYPATASRAYELAYWNDIQTLAEGEYRNKDNADCVVDKATLTQETCRSRDLDRLGDYLISRHQGAIREAGMEGKALCGELPFHWQTDFDFPLFGGWKSNQQDALHERDILVVIPGKDRSQAVILADHYDTAYMEDVYDPSRGGSGARSSAAGADDNYSATATLLQAAPVYLQMSKQGRLETDIWLLHLTGEEFPADCLGARHFCQALIEKKLVLHINDNATLDLSATRVNGIFLMDMIAHNRDDNKDVFQISPGRGAPSLKLARQAHLANLAWNANAPDWNASPEREAAAPARRSPDGTTIPEVAPHLPLSGEVRTQDDWHSSLYNTDGQIFSDAGIPVVLFMENYDINRTGYHDTHDNMQNLDLDYGAALSAIAIESCAREAMKL